MPEQQRAPNHPEEIELPEPLDLPGLGPADDGVGIADPADEIEWTPEGSDDDSEASDLPIGEVDIADDGGPHTQHTTNPVPFIVVNPPATVRRLENGRLADVAPTLLDLLGLDRPAAMTGHSLIGDDARKRAAD